MTWYAMLISPLCAYLVCGVTAVPDPIQFASQFAASAYSMACSSVIARPSAQAAANGAPSGRSRIAAQKCSWPAASGRGIVMPNVSRAASAPPKRRAARSGFRCALAMRGPVPRCTLWRSTCLPLPRTAPDSLYTILSLVRGDLRIPAVTETLEDRGGPLDVGEEGDRPGRQCTHA